MYSANFRVYKYFIKNNDTCRLEKAPGQSKHDTLSPDNKHRLTEKWFSDFFSGNKEYPRWRTKMLEANFPGPSLLFHETLIWNQEMNHPKTICKNLVIYLEVSTWKIGASPQRGYDTRCEPLSNGVETGRDGRRISNCSVVERFCLRSRCYKFHRFVSLARRDFSNNC